MKILQITWTHFFQNLFPLIASAIVLIYWKKFLDQKKNEVAVIMELSKAFDSIPHDLLIAGMHTCGFSIDNVTFFYSCLKRCKQNMNINNTVFLLVFKFYYLGFLKVQYLDQFYSAYFLMIYISAYQKRTC